MKLTIPTPQPDIRFVNVHILGICLTLITACSVFKERSFLQADSLQKQNIRRETKARESTQVDAVRIYNHQDSSEKQSFTEIFPEGLFNYSAKDGFTGIASRLVINEQLKAGSKDSESMRANVINKTASNTTETERQLTQTRLKEKALNTQNYTLWYLAALALIFAVVYYFRSVFNEPNN